MSRVAPVAPRASETHTSDAYLTVEQVAERIHLSPYQVRDLLKKGDLPGTRRGRRWLIGEEALDLYLAGGENAAAQALRRRRRRDPAHAV